jgi:Fe-Mn family superoxide dismutase
VSTIDRRTFLTSAAAGAAGLSLASSACAAPQGAASAPAQTPQIAMAKYTAISVDHLKGGLDGLSAGLLEQHVKLYQGYVTRTNALLAKTTKMVESGDHINDQKAPVPEYCELKRRFGFEFNGMVLHEYYFKNLVKGGSEIPTGSPFTKAVEKDFGSLQNWRSDFDAISKAPGVGWILVVQDPRTKRILNHWVGMHEDGNIAGFHVVLALDLWEHAFVGDYLPTERGKYLTAFGKNIDWEAVAGRVVS